MACICGRRSFMMKNDGKVHGDNNVWIVNKLMGFFYSTILTQVSTSTDKQQMI